jgi:predicted GNAT family N-acyltransferase
VILKPLLEAADYQFKLIEYGSPEYQQAAHLRYRLFYQAHSIPFAAIFDLREQQDLHLAITEHSTQRVLAYGRLGQTSSNQFQIYQMVVEPECQGQGLGKTILQALTEAAIQRGASLLTLNARVAQMQFYQKLGFQPVGEMFPSSMTGIPHIKMQKRILQ